MTFGVGLHTLPLRRYGSVGGSSGLAQKIEQGQLVVCMGVANSVLPGAAMFMRFLGEYQLLCYKECSLRQDRRYYTNLESGYESYYFLTATILSCLKTAAWVLFI